MMATKYQIAKNTKLAQKNAKYMAKNRYNFATRLSTSCRRAKQADSNSRKTDANHVPNKQFSGPPMRMQGWESV